MSQPLDNELPDYTPTDVRFTTPQRGLDVTPYLPEVKQEIPQEASFLDKARAYYRQNDVAYNAFVGLTDNIKTIGEFSGDIDRITNFSPLSEEYQRLIPKDKPLWNAQLARTDTPGEFYRMLTRLQMAEDDYAAIAQMGWGEALAAGLTVNAPLMFIPIAQGLRTVNPIKAGALNVLKQAPAFAAIEATSEIALHALQPDRTMQESALNVLGATVLGGIFSFGGGVYAAMKPHYYKKAMAAHLKGNGVKFGLDENNVVTHFNIYENDSAGAMRVRRLDLKGESLYGWSKGKEFPSLSKGKVAEIADYFNNALGRKPKEAEQYLASILDNESAVKIIKAPPNQKLSTLLDVEKYRGRFAPEDTASDVFKIIDAEFGNHYNIAAAPFIWTSGKLARNPVILGLTSKSAYTARFVNDMYEHNFDLFKNVVKGENIPIPMQRKLWQYDNMAFRAERLINNSYTEYLKKFKDNKNQAYKFKDYVAQLYIPIISGKPHADPFINSIAHNIYEATYKPITEELIRLGIFPKDIKPKAAAGYINRLYDRDFMRANRKYTIDFFTSEFTNTREKLIEATKIRRQTEEQINNLKDQISEAYGVKIDENLRNSLKKQVQSLQRKVRKLKNAEYMKMESGQFSDDMFTGSSPFTAQEREQLKSLRKPIKQHKAKIKDIKAKIRVSKIEKQSKEILQALEKELVSEKDKLRLYREKLLDKRDLQELPSYFFRGQYLRAPKKGDLKLRPILNDQELGQAAQNLYDTILSTTESQFADHILGGQASGPKAGGENPFMGRTNMISDEALYASGIMQTDLRKNIRAFTSRAGKVIEMTKYLAQDSRYASKTDPSKFLAKNVKQDFQIEYRKLDAKYTHKKEGLSGDALEKVIKQEQKAHQKLAAEEQLALDVVAQTYGNIMGLNSPKYGKLLRSARFMNNWAYSTQMGAISLLQFQDFVAPIFRTGFVPWVKHGPIAVLSNIVKLKHIDNVRLKESAADLGVACELSSAFMGHKFRFENEFELPAGMAEKFMQNAADLMGVVSGSTIISDASNFVGVTVIQSDLRRQIGKLVNGTISKEDAIRLRALGIGDERISKLINGFADKYGENLSGAFLPNWHMWANQATNTTEKAAASEAKQMFQQAVLKELRSTIFNGNSLANLPLGLTPGGIHKSVLIYMGWMMNAVGNFTIPLLQRPTPRRLAGIGSMLAMSYLVSPLREIANGKEPNLDPWHLTKKAFINSGFLGYYLDVFNRVNSMGRIFPELMTDRYEQKGLDLAAGMPYTVAKNLGNLMGMLFNNDWNQKEIEGIIKTLPTAWAIEFRRIIKAALEETGLQEKPERGVD